VRGAGLLLRADAMRAVHILGAAMACVCVCLETDGVVT
jgi:hypothetical protein